MGGFQTGPLLGTEAAQIDDPNASAPLLRRQAEPPAPSSRSGQLSEGRGPGHGCEPIPVPTHDHARPAQTGCSTSAPKEPVPAPQSHRDITYPAAVTFSRNDSLGKLLQPERLSFRLSQVFSVKLLMFLINFCHPQLLQWPEAWRD